MARARNIKPGFFLNDELAKLDPLTRLLFAGLWCIADREGRLIDRPLRIKAEVLPYDNCDIEKLLDDLHHAKFITRYIVNDNHYIEIRNFTKHQNPHPKEAPSIIPAFTEQAQEKQLTSNLLATDKPIAKNADPLLSIPSDSLLPITALDNAGVKPRKLFKTKTQEERFDQYWKMYPKKKSKGDAEKAWVSINPDDLLFKKIINGVEAGLESNEWKKDGGEYIPHPATWLNRKGWEDEYTQGQPQHKPAYKPRASDEGQSPAAIISGKNEEYVAPEILEELRQKQADRESG